MIFAQKNIVGYEIRSYQKEYQYQIPDMIQILLIVIVFHYNIQE